MDTDFNVERVALHLINKKYDKLNLADHEVDLGAFTSKEDIDAVKKFFSGHLQVVWKRLTKPLFGSQLSRRIRRCARITTT